MATYFTPPHRNRFALYADPGIAETLTEPLLALKPEIPQPINLWLWNDGLLHERQPAVVTPDTKWFQGGTTYGPLSQADIDLLTASGYGAYLHDVPTPPEP